MKFPTVTQRDRQTDRNTDYGKFLSMRKQDSLIHEITEHSNERYIILHEVTGYSYS